MNRLRIILLVCLPTIAISAIAAICYSRIFAKSNVNATVKSLEKATINAADVFNNKCKIIASQTNQLANLVESDPEATTRAIEMIIKANPEIAYVSVGYDPEFLKEFNEGKHPDFRPISAEDGVKSFEIGSNHYAPGFYRLKNGYQRLDDTDTAYETYDWFLGPSLANGGVWVDPFVSRTTRTIITAYGIPFHHQDRVVGVVSAFVKMPALVEGSVVENLANSDYYNFRYFLIDRSAKIIFHYDGTPWIRTNLYSLLEEIGRTDLSGRVDEIIQKRSGNIVLPDLNNPHTDPKKENTWFVHAEIGDDMKWNLVAAFVEDEVTGNAQKTATKILWGGIGLSLFLSILISLLLLNENRPLESLTKVARSVAGGDFAVITPEQLTERKDGIGELSRALKFMVESMNENITKVVKESSKRKMMERELLIAQNIQKSFLPSREKAFPHAKSFDIAADLVPARFVAGDFFDFWPLDDDNIAVVIADVSGKGVPAALVMIESRTLLRQFATAGLSPGEVLSELNRNMQLGNKTFMFVTLFLFFYNRKTGEVRYANAGHNPPILIHQDGKVTWFDLPKSPVIGIIPDAKYSTMKFVLQPSETLFLYTDGVLDATDADGETFGKFRLFDLLKNVSRKNASDALNVVIGQLENYRGPVQKDDITVIILQRTNKTNKASNAPPNK